MRSGIFVSGVASDIKVSGDTVQFTLTGSKGSHYQVSAPVGIFSRLPKEGERMEISGDLSFFDGNNLVWARRAEAKSADIRRERKNARVRNGRV